MKYRILLNEKYSHKHPYFKKSQNKDLFSFFDKYKGFEGECLYYYESDDLKELEIICENKRKEIIDLNQSSLVLLICVKTNGNKIKNVMNLKHAFFVGYDYGILLEMDELYSSILQEVLFGTIEELKSFKEELNEHYLFSTFEMASNYVKKHHQLSVDGKDVEMENDMRIFEIWEITL